MFVKRPPPPLGGMGCAGGIFCWGATGADVDCIGVFVFAGTGAVVVLLGVAVCVGFGVAEEEVTPFLENIPGDPELLPEDDFPPFAIV